MFGRTLPPCSCGSRRLVQCDRGDEVEAFWWKGTMNFVSREKKLICCQLLQVDIVEGDHEVLLTFENGVTASADLVVASDGIHSFVSRCRVWHYDHPSAALILSPIDAFCSGRSPLFLDQRKSETRRLDWKRQRAADACLRLTSVEGILRSTISAPVSCYKGLAWLQFLFGLKNPRE